MNPIDTLFEVATPVQRKLLENVRYVPESECWEWLNGSTNIRISQERTGHAKTISFELFVGPIIPGDMVVSECAGDYCINPAHLKAAPKVIWDKDKCSCEALKFNSRSAFQKGSKTAYGSAFKNGWLGEICGHMVSLKKPNGYWTAEKCKEEASKYTNRADFFKHSKAAYHAANRDGILGDVCSHMVRPDAHNKRWSLEKCRDAAIICDSFKEFQTVARPAYSAAKKAGWLDEICVHMSDRQKKRKRLTPIAA